MEQHMPTYEAIEYDVTDRVAVVRMNRPEKHNALNSTLIDELTAAIEHAEAEDDLRAVILTGNGELFSAGFDLNEAAGGEEDVAPIRELLDRYESVPRHVHAIFDCNLPVISAVNGHALAGGMTLALICDLTIASEEAEFGYPGMRMGGFPATLIYPYVMGSMKFTRELLYSGKRISADEAERFGMINRAVPEENVMDEAWAEVDEIKKVPKTVVRLCKQALNGAVEIQGYHPTIKYSELVDTLAHLTEEGQKFNEIRAEEGVQGAIEWMNTVDKS